ncbi:ABC-type metal ion transport periplasmic component surface adhesin [Babesia ovata]|uniref:ABC-type metal ion transport periplasmic component surface adhesin n=1 Tax=Babesia ovata TaxID=189622 RepID=A0A2H6K7U4_9APIC|nr:ABC-type metal ion transport periplasmic component surface adhesin [Babesia ovata]GBE59066.1 ABC-type metal ion transport periplasmic component surface adhesin [Babesia ovata]
MAYSWDYDDRDRRLHGVTPVFSCVAYFFVGISVTLVYALGYVGSIALLDGLGINAELSNAFYNTRQLIIFCAFIGASIALLFGLGGRISLAVEQCLLTVCYCGAAGYIWARSSDLHLRVNSLMRFAPATAMLSSMAQTAAIYCMTDYSMPGGVAYTYYRLTAFFVGTAMAGPLLSCWFVGNWLLGGDSEDIGMLFYVSRSRMTLMFLCCLAAGMCAIAAALTIYMFLCTGEKTCLDKECWFPLIMCAPCHISRDSLKKQINSLYVPLLWTANPLFIAFVIAVTHNPSRSVNLVFTQFIVYAVAAIAPAWLAYFENPPPRGEFFGHSAGMRRVLGAKHANRREVLKTTGADALMSVCRQARMFKDVATYQESIGNSQMRAVSHLKKRTMNRARVSATTQWTLLHGELWAQWQCRDSTYLLCTQAVERIYHTLWDLGNLYSGSLYDNVDEIMKQYCDFINCNGMLHGMPFAVDPSWDSLQLLHKMLLHQKSILMLQTERTGTMYADGLTKRIDATACSFLNRLTTFGQCCMCVLRRVVDTNDYEKESKHGHGRITISHSRNASIRAISGCTCCFLSKQTHIKDFLKSSISSVKDRCGSLVNDIHKQEIFNEKGDVPEKLSLELERRLMCMLRSYCESIMLLIDILLTIDELILIQEWLCKLCWDVKDIHRKLRQRRKCDCEDHEEDHDEHDHGEEHDHGHEGHSEHEHGNDEEHGNGHNDHDADGSHHSDEESHDGHSDEDNDDGHGHGHGHHHGGCRGHGHGHHHGSDTEHHEYTPKCVWKLLEKILRMICKVLIMLHSYKNELIRRIVEMSKCCTESKHSEALYNDEFSAVGLLNTIRVMVILVLSISDLLKLNEYMVEWDKTTKSDTNKCNDTYHLLQPSAEYMHDVMKRILAPGETFIDSLIDDVVLWYSGLVDTIGQLCPDMALKEKSSYTTIIRKDKEVNVKDPDSSFLNEYTNLTGGLLDACLKGAVEAAASLEARSKICEMTYKEVAEEGGKQPKHTPRKSHVYNHAYTECPKNVVPSEKETCDSAEEFKIYVKTLAESVGKVLSCAKDSSVECDDIGDLCQNLEVTSCGTPADTSSCPPSCCKDSETARFSRFVTQLVNCVSENKELKCNHSGPPGSQCSCCADEKGMLGAKTIADAVYPILKYCFCCAKCDPSGPTASLSCGILFIFHTVYTKVCDNKGVQVCTKSPSCTSTVSPSLQNCSCSSPPSSCPLCDKVKEVCHGMKTHVCRNPLCWRERVRCYVMCGASCGPTSKKCEEVNCQGCNCKQGTVCGEGCNLRRLSDSLFHCDGCLETQKSPRSKAATVAVAPHKCKMKSCACSEQIEMKYGSPIAMGTSCCSHKLGCALQIITEDVNSLKSNATTLKVNLVKLTQCAAEISQNVAKVNKSLTAFCNLLEFAHCGLKKRMAKMEKMYEVAGKVRTTFPCYEQQINQIAAAEERVVQTLLGLFRFCLKVAYKNILLIQNITWTLATVAMQCLRLKFLNTKITQIKAQVNRAWYSLVGMKGSKTSALGFVSGSPGFNTLSTEDKLSVVYNARLKGERASQRFKPNLDYYSDVGPFACLKYIWVLLCFWAVMGFFHWFGVQHSVSRSKTLLTAITALSALHLSSAVMSGTLHRGAGNGAGGKMGTRINLMVLLGIAVILILSWISNITGTYRETTNSLNYVTEKLRVVGIYDNGQPPATQLIKSTVTKTFLSDIQSAFGIWGSSGSSRAGSIPLWYVLGPLSQTTAGANPHGNRSIQRKEVKFHHFVMDQAMTPIKSLDWVLNLMSFLQLFPDDAQMINVSAPFLRNLNPDAELLWVGWETNTYLTDDFMNSMIYFHNVLHDLNLDLLEELHHMGKMEYKLKLISLWNIFFRGQSNTVPLQATKFNVERNMVMNKQRKLQQEEIAVRYINDWHEFHTWLANCSRYVYKRKQYYEKKMEEQVAAETEAKEEPKVASSWMDGGRDLFSSEESTPDISQPINAAPIATMDGDSDLGDDDGTDSDLDETCSRGCWKLRKRLAAKLAGKTDGADDSSGHNGVVSNNNKSAVKSMPGGGDNTRRERYLNIEEPADPLEWLLLHEPCEECVEHFKRQGAQVFTDGSEKAIFVLTTGRLYEDIQEKDELLEQAEEWKRKKEVFCSNSSEFAESCLAAVKETYDRVVEFAAEDNKGNLVKLLHDTITEMKPTKHHHRHIKDPTPKAYLPSTLREKNDVAALYREALLMAHHKQTEKPRSETSEKHRRAIVRATKTEDPIRDWWQLLTWMGQWLWTQRTADVSNVLDEGDRAGGAAAGPGSRLFCVFCEVYEQGEITFSLARMAARSPLNMNPDASRPCNATDIEENCGNSPMIMTGIIVVVHFSSLPPKLLSAD